MTLPHRLARLSFLLPLLVALQIVPALAQAPAARGKAAEAPKPDPVALLAGAKAASGGAAWDALRTQHSEVRLTVAGMTGNVERWNDITTGQSTLRFSIGPLAGASGFDGKAVWTQDGTEPPKIETDAAALELAANAAYRDKLAFWYPDRGRARIEFKERKESEGRKYDVVTVAPEGGRPFEFWIDAETKLIAQLVEREAQATRVEHYSDRREVQGVRIPFKVRTTRGDPKMDEVVDVQTIAFNQPLANVSFAPPVEQQDLLFPGGRAQVEVPFEALSGHLFVRVLLDGRGPFRMLLDAGGANVLTRQTAQLLVGDGKPVPRSLLVASTGIEGVELTGQRYLVGDIEPFLRRVEGVDDVAGVLGLEWFVRMPIKLDYARSRLTLYDPAAFKYAGTGIRVPVAVRGRLPQVAGSIDGIPGMFEIDTGSRGSVTLVPSFAAKNDLEEEAQREDRGDYRRRRGGAAAGSARARQVAEARDRRRAQPGGGDPAPGRRRGRGQRRARGQRGLRRDAPVRGHLRPAERFAVSRALSQLRHARHRGSRRAVARAAAGGLQGRRRGERRPRGAGGIESRRRDRRVQRRAGRAAAPAGGARCAALDRRVARESEDGGWNRGDDRVAGSGLGASTSLPVVQERRRLTL